MNAVKVVTESMIDRSATTKDTKDTKEIEETKTRAGSACPS
jgi:hypothetical protein